MPVVEPVHQLAGVTLVSELADDLLQSLGFVLVNPQQGVRGRPLARLLLETTVYGQDDVTVLGVFLIEKISD